MTFIYILLLGYILSIIICILIYKLEKDSSDIHLIFVPLLNTFMIIVYIFIAPYEILKKQNLIRKLERWIEK